MSETTTRDEQTLVALVTDALAQEHRAGLSEVLRSIARTLGADGCILWQEAPFSKLDATPPSGELFVLAEWFDPPDHCSLHNLSLQSATGQAILLGEAVAVHDVATDDRVDRKDRFLEEARICCFCSVPTKFLNGKKGALNAYRRVRKPFTPGEVAKLRGLARLLPSLYKTITDKVSYRLVRTINRILQEAEAKEADPPKSPGAFFATTERICREIADSLKVVEVSVFLENRLELPGVFRLAATTWPEDLEFPKQTYHAAEGEGLTGWALAHRAPILLFDLAHFDPKREQVQKNYPGLRWNDSLRVERSMRQILDIPEGQKLLQPLSFLAVPILLGDRLLGVIRCCTIREGPFYLTEQEVKLLGLVAAQIGQAWSHWLSRREIEEENQALERFVTSIGELNRSIEKQVALEKPDEKMIFHRALQTTSSIIYNAEISDIRLLDERSNELYFEAVHGDAWNTGSLQEVRKRRHRHFPVGEDRPSSGGSHVVQTQQVYLIPDTSDPAYFYSETFPDTRRMIIAPIGIAGRILGVLDIRGTGEREFPRHAIPIAELLGQQLGLYHYLLRTISEIRNLPRQQAQTLQDFAHQIRSPILQLHIRARTCLQLGNKYSVPERMQNHLLALRGLAAKARRVSQSLGIFADLARGNPLQPQLSRLDRDALVKMLIESGIDQQSTLSPDRNIHFQVARDSFDVLYRVSVEVDANLLFQAVNNLLDNAAKYSYPRTTVRIEGSLTGTGRFSISVLNTGVPISQEEARMATERNWRSSAARDVTGEGSGIGLWIVHHIMEAHGGEVMVLPTTREGLTEVKLLFPVERPRKQSTS